MLTEIKAIYLQAKQFVIKCFANFPAVPNTYPILNYITALIILIVLTPFFNPYTV